MYSAQSRMPSTLQNSTGAPSVHPAILPKKAPASLSSYLSPSYCFHSLRSACGRSLPSCDGASERTVGDLITLTLKDGQSRALSCYTQTDSSRGVGWASGPLPGKGLVYAAMMEGEQSFPGRMMADRLARAFRSVGL